MDIGMVYMMAGQGDSTIGTKKLRGGNFDREMTTERCVSDEIYIRCTTTLKIIVDSHLNKSKKRRRVF
jgi:hypothetical protein